ncbi:ketoacyl-ACP synthase III family protein [Kitasatospora aureofaciens]|uniref:ketoacyl-ACP synthase III family protein n=1 Tax=Kitasatospora aureofaciens TaxID=1894 RepID=UPI000524B69C|nr:ketoacyl-ACP synthase III family protein [Kitasatospora aureofaciens]HJD83565.1 ketoacyl-ACP synthase III family protein [Kitasatospora aureofaciens]
MKTDHLYIAGLAGHLPRLWPIAEAVAAGRPGAEHARDGGWTSVSVADDTPAPELAAEAARLALKRSGLTAEEVCLVVHAGVYHQGPDGWYAANYVQDQVLGTTAPAIGLNQGCTAMLDAARLAHGHLVHAPQGSAVLVSAADNFGTPTWDRFTYAHGWNTGRASILGDAGCAVLLSATAGPLRIRSLALSSLSSWERLYRGTEDMFPPAAAGGGLRIPLGRRMSAFAEQVEDRDLRLTMARELAEARTAVARQAIDEAGVTSADITRVTHVFSGSPRYVEGLLGPLGIAPERGMLDLGRTVGHLGACDQFLALAHLVDTGAVGPGDHVLLMGNGGGISLAAAVVEVLDRPTW